MIGRLFQDDPFISLRKGLSASSLKQQVIANNIANINTPGYKKQDVNFEDEFKRAVRNKYEPLMHQTDSRHLPGGRGIGSVKISVNTIKGTAMRYDGNNVDIDEEMSKLSENGLRFNATAQLMSIKFNTLRTVVNEGRR